MAGEASPAPGSWSWLVEAAETLPRWWRKAVRWCWSREAKAAGTFLCPPNKTRCSLEMSPCCFFGLTQQVCWTLEKWFEFELSKTWKLNVYHVFVFLIFNRRIHWWLECKSGTIHGRVANLRQSSWTNVLTVTISSGPHFECEFHWTPFETEAGFRDPWNVYIFYI